MISITMLISLFCYTNPMDHMSSDKLERYSFLWSEVRLVVAAVALFLGGVPPITRFAPGLSGTLPLAWIISGLVSAYLLYQWNARGRRLFGGTTPLDMYAFFVSVVSGLNLGLVPIVGTNIGMSLSSNRGLLVIVGLLYLVAANHLYRRWNASGQKIF